MLPDLSRLSLGPDRRERRSADVGLIFWDPKPKTAPGQRWATRIDWVRDPDPLSNCAPFTVMISYRGKYERQRSMYDQRPPPTVLPKLLVTVMQADPAEVETWPVEQHEHRYTHPELWKSGRRVFGFDMEIGAYDDEEAKSMAAQLDYDTRASQGPSTLYVEGNTMFRRGYCERRTIKAAIRVAVLSVGTMFPSVTSIQYKDVMVPSLYYTDRDDELQDDNEFLKTYGLTPEAVFERFKKCFFVYDYYKKLGFAFWVDGQSYTDEQHLAQMKDSLDRLYHDVHTGVVRKLIKNTFDHSRQPGEAYVGSYLRAGSPDITGDLVAMSALNDPYDALSRMQIVNVLSDDNVAGARDDPRPLQPRRSARIQERKEQQRRLAEPERPVMR